VQREKAHHCVQIREVIENHHNIFADFIKKPTIYYQLERLAHDGYLEVRKENVEAPGTGSARDRASLLRCSKSATIWWHASGYAWFCKPALQPHIRARMHLYITRIMCRIALLCNKNNLFISCLPETGSA
jgi:hypothetical protein